MRVCSKRKKYNPYNGRNTIIFYEEELKHETFQKE